MTGHAAKKRRGGEAGDVAEHPAADRHDRARAIGVRPDQGVVDAADGLEILVAFAVRQQDRLFGVMPAKSGS